MLATVRPHPLTTWLLTLVVSLAACVPAGGLTLCVHESHGGLGALGAGKGCPCDPEDHPEPDGNHHDLEVESLDGAPSPSDDAVAAPVVADAPSLAWPAALSADARALVPRSRGPTPPDHLRIVRTVVLLI